LKNQLAARVASTPQPTVVDLISIGDVASPPPASVLCFTLLELLGLAEEEADRTWETFSGLVIGDLSLSDAVISSLCRPYLCLEDSLELLISSSFGYLQSLFLDDSHFDEILTVVVEDISTRLGHTVRPQLDLLSSEAFLSGVRDTLPTLPLAAVAGTELLASCFPDRHMRCVADLLELSESSVFQELGFGALALRATQTCWLLREELEWLDALDRAQSEMTKPGCLADEIRSALVASLPPKRSGEKNIRVLLRRLGLESGSPMTLEETAAPFGITRERVRQLEAKTVDALDVTAFMDELVPLRVDLYSIIATHGWGMLTRDLAGQLANKRGWSETPSDAALKALAACLPECMPDTGENLVLLSDEGCSDCIVMSRVVDEVVSEGVPVPVSGFWDLVMKEAVTSRPDCYECTQHDPVVVAALLDSVLAERPDELRRTDGWILPQALARRRPNSLAFRAEEALRRSGRCLHFKEVVKLLADADPSKKPPSPRNVYAALDRLPDVINWDSGSFIHKESMPFPYAVVRGVEEWITHELQQSGAPPMLSVHGVYEHFRQELAASGVPSELALYSLLRISAEPGLLYPKYPQIYLEASFEQRLPLALVLDDFVRSAGGVVSMDELREFVTEDMGFKEFQLTQALALLPSVLRVGDGAYLHIDYARVPARILDKIARHAEGLVHQEGYVSVQRVYDDLEVDCALHGITSAEMLFSLLQLEDRGDLMANRYPLLVHREDGKASSMTVQASIAAFLQEKGAPCSSAELEDEFVDKRGYEERTVHLAWLHPDVYRYLPGSLVHKTTIYWDDTRQVALEEAAHQFADDASKAGRYFATIHELLECVRLPDIGHELVWTQQLVADLLSRGESCILLGNARNAFVTNPNRYGISSLGGLVAQIVRHEYGGGVNLSVLQAILQSEGVILKSLTPAMLGAESDAAVVGQEVILNGVADA